MDSPLHHAESSAWIYKRSASAKPTTGNSLLVIETSHKEAFRNEPLVERFHVCIHIFNFAQSFRRLQNPVIDHRNERQPLKDRS